MVNVYFTPCAEPTLITEEIVTETTAKLSYTGATLGAEVRYATTIAGLSTAAITTVAGNDTTIKGLTPSTKYYYEVRSICSGSRTSEWVLDSFQTAAPKTPMLEIRKDCKCFYDNRSKKNKQLLYNRRQEADLECSFA
jgi:hypothetical protein